MVGALAWSCAAWAASVTPPVATVPGSGEQQAVFTVDTFGRYAVTATSPHGAAVRVIDAATGPGQRAGEPGERDGRVDVFLERGRVKVEATSPPGATDDVALRVTPFAPDPDPRQLVPAHAVRAELRDLQTRAYWVDLDTARSFALEASGRYLADLRLWRDGSWLVDAAPTCRTVEPVLGQPWQRCQLVTSLEPGLYLLTAYGGEGDAWAEASDDAPLHLMWDLPHLGTAGVHTEAVGADGLLRFAVPPGPDTFVLTLPDVADATLAVGPGTFVDGAGARITTESRRPVATVQADERSASSVAITAPPGTVATLTWFHRATSATLSEPGHYWVSTLSADDPTDVFEPTALAYRTNGGRDVQVEAQGLPLDASHQIHREATLGRSTRFLLDVGAAGPYVARIEGVDAKLRIVPYFTRSLPKNFQLPEPTRGQAHADLDRALYVLEVETDAPGIATLTIAHDSWFSRAKRQVTTAEVAAVRPAVQFTDLDVERDDGITVTIATPTPTGVVVRSLPLDPDDPLPMVLMPGEVVSVPIMARDPGRLTALGFDGQALPLSVDGSPEVRSVPLPVGAHTVKVRSDRDAPVRVTLGLVPDARTRPLPALDPARLRELPAFPALDDGPARFVTLGAGRSETFALTVPSPGLYVAESTGLLATEGAVRTRIVTALASGRSNGVGRNFAVARYYGAGEYQLTVSTLGQSAGRLGVQLRRTEIRDGGDLPLGRMARATVPAGDAVRYRFTLDERATVRVVHRGRTDRFRCRLEDDDGWPVTAPEIDCDTTLTLPAGSYVILGLPSLVQTRRTTQVLPDRLPVVREGHGPFALAVGERVDHVWMEPADGGDERPADQWDVALAAPVHATVQLSPEMAGTLSVGDDVVARLVPGETWQGEIPAGTAHLEVRGARKGTGVPYALVVDTEELVAGGTRRVTAPASVPVAIGAPGVYTLASAGQLDVRARLVDAGGRTVGAADDRPDGWNFQLSARLDPGRYTLLVEDVTGAPGAVGAGGGGSGEYDEYDEYAYDDDGGGYGDEDVAPTYATDGAVEVSCAPRARSPAPRWAAPPSRSARATTPCCSPWTAAAATCSAPRPPAPRTWAWRSRQPTAASGAPWPTTPAAPPSPARGPRARPACASGARTPRGRRHGAGRGAERRERRRRRHPPPGQRRRLRRRQAPRRPRRLRGDPARRHRLGLPHRRRRLRRHRRPPRRRGAGRPGAGGARRRGAHPARAARPRARAGARGRRAPHRRPRRRGRRGGGRARPGRPARPRAARRPRDGRGRGRLRGGRDRARGQGQRLERHRRRDGRAGRGPPAEAARAAARPGRAHIGGGARGRRRPAVRRRPPRRARRAGPRARPRRAGRPGRLGRARRPHRGPARRVGPAGARQPDRAAGPRRARRQRRGPRRRRRGRRPVRAPARRARHLARPRGGGEGSWHLAGAATGTLLRADGAVVPVGGEVGGGGVLALDAEPGPLVAWVGAHGPVREVRAGRPEPVAGPGRSRSTAPPRPWRCRSRPAAWPGSGCPSPPSPPSTCPAATGAPRWCAPAATSTWSCRRAAPRSRCAPSPAPGRSRAPRCSRSPSRRPARGPRPRGPARPRRRRLVLLRARSARPPSGSAPAPPPSGSRPSSSTPPGRRWPAASC
ncbi:MAG: hypothetical protein R3F59_20775 [Myxococcota bacterium]